MTDTMGSTGYPVAPNREKMDQKGSTGQLYVQVKKRRTRLQYKRNQDAINFLRRFTLAVVIIDLMLAISESSLISTFFLFLTLSTTFDVKPENVIDTYCHHFQGGGNLMCEQYMERVTGYMSNQQRVPNSWSSSASPPSDNHFATKPGWSPLTPSESRKLFQAYNQSLSDSPARFSFHQKLDKNLHLAQLYSKLVYLLYNGNDTGSLNKTLLEFLATKNPREGASNFEKLESLTNQLKQSIEIVESGLPTPFNLKRGQCIVFRPTLKSFDGLKPQRLKQKRIREGSVPPLPRKLSPVKPFVQVGNLIQHRWKRSTTGENTQTGAVEFSNGSPVGRDAANLPGAAEIRQGTQKPADVLVVRVGVSKSLKGQRLQDSNFEVDEQTEVLEDYIYYDATKKPRKVQEDSHPGENCKSDASAVLTRTETYLKHLERKNFDWQRNGTENIVVLNKGKCLQELPLGLDKTPRQILSLMEASLFNNWEHFSQALQRLSLSYQIDSPPTTDFDKEDCFVWPSIREEIIQNLLFHSEMNVFSPEISKQAERRKHAIEQIYHDYSSSILVQLENVKEMPVSPSFLGIYKVIKMYMMLWQTVICLVLLHGSVFEDKTALNIWGIFNILTSFLHFMVDDWINTSFQPEKTSASIWFGVIYGVYKPITILLVATLSSEIFRKERANNKGAIARVCEIIKGRKQPPLVAGKCLEKLKGVLITADSWGDCDNKKNKSINAAATSTTGENNNGSSDNIVYTGIKMVKIRAKIKRMEVNNGNLIVITHTTTGTSGARNEHCCLICGSPASTTESENTDCDEEKMLEGRLFSPSGEIDNEAGMTAEDLYPDDSDDEEDDDDDELEGVIDEDDESEEEDDGVSDERQKEKVGNLKEENEKRNGFSSNEEQIAVLAKMTIHSKLAGGKDSVPESAKQCKDPHFSNPLIGCGASRAQGTFLHAEESTRGSDGQGDDLLHGPIVDGGNVHI